MNLVLWNLREKDSTANGDIPDGVQSGPAREFTKEELESVRASPVRSRLSLQIKQEHCDEFGYTHRCPGCSARLRGLARQAHSEACKARFSQLLETKAFLENEDAQEVGAKRRSEEVEEVRLKKTRVLDADGRPGSSTDTPVGDVPMSPVSPVVDAQTEHKSTDVPDEAMLESRRRQSDMSLDELETNIGQILCDIRGNETAWDDVNENLELPIEDILSARA